MKALATAINTYNEHQFACNYDRLPLTNPQDIWFSFNRAISNYRSRHTYRATS